MLLAIDIGTSSAKAILFDPQTGQIKAVRGQEYPLQKPTPERAEQNPDDWWQAVTQIVPQVMQEAGIETVSAIGLTGQMHGTVLLDPARKPLHPAIIWADQRSAAQTQQMVESVGAEAFTAITGTMPAAGFMGPTLLWLQTHYPNMIEQAAHVILPKDYVRLRLTGEVATDISDAAATALFDVRRGTWADGLIKRFALPRHLFPPVLASAEVAGQLTTEAANALGLRAGIPVVAGCADQPAQAITNGLINPGVAAVTTGTGGQVFLPLHISDNTLLPTDPRLHVFNHALPGHWYALGAILAAGLALRWLRGITGLNGNPNAYEILSAEAARVEPGAAGLLFLPYLSGERTPHMDPNARGAFIGLSDYHERGHLARAVMEGVAFALRDALELCLSLGQPAQKIIAAGGGAESDVWRSIQADVFGLPLQRTLQAEQTCIGAAVLAGVAVGEYATIDDGSAKVAQFGHINHPDMYKNNLYNELYLQFRSLYPRLRADFIQLTTFSMKVTRQQLL